jgi:hypothetical protein
MTGIDEKGKFMLRNGVVNLSFPNGRITRFLYSFVSCERRTKHHYETTL